MLDLREILEIIIPELKGYMGIPLSRSTQVTLPPSYPYAAYTITSPRLNNAGSYGIIAYDNGLDDLSRLHFKQVAFVLSFTVAALDEDEAYKLSAMAYEWFELDGVTFLRNHNIGVVKIENLAARDNILSMETEYRHGFDVRLSTMDEAYRVDEYFDRIEIQED